MRKALFGSLALLAAAMLLVPATAVASDTVFKFNGGLLTRGEYLQNFTDGEDTADGPQNKDDADFVFYRANFGVHAEVNSVDAYVEIQNYGTWGDSLSSMNAQDPLLGNLWLTNLANNNDMQLYQAWFSWNNIADSMVSLKIGRQEKTLGNELHLGNFDFYTGQYYDGINANFDMEDWQLDIFWFKPYERDLFPGALASIPDPVLVGGSDDTDLIGVTANFGVADGDILEPYILYKKQADEFSPIYPRYYTYTVGAMYKRPQEHDSPFDFSIEAAAQFGEAKQNFLFNICPAGTPDCDISSVIAEGWFGYSFQEDGESHNRVRIGGLMIGDGDDAQDIEGFMHLYPDTHRRAGALDLFSEISVSLPALEELGIDSFHNLTTYHVGWDWTDGTHAIDVSGHVFTLTEDFGGPDDDLGNEFDIIYDYMHGEHLGLQAGLAFFSPGDVFDNDMQDTVGRVWGQALVRF